MSEPDIVAQLRQLGWTQGSYLPVTPSMERVWHELLLQDATGARDAPIWGLQREPIDGAAYLVVVSQICDILKSVESEPRVETIVASWTIDKAKIHGARTNSHRYFLLQTRSTNDGVEEGLVADVADRIPLAKQSLASAKPIQTFVDNNREIVRRFQAWLGDRFSRQPLPDDLVKAVQLPIVNANRKLKASDEKYRILGMIDYILCRILAGGSPMEVELLYVSREPGDEPQFTEEEAAEVAGWMQSAIRKKGLAELVHWERFTTTTISVYDFENSFELALGEFSLSTDSAGHPPVGDQNTGIPRPTSESETPKPRKSKKRQAG